MLINVIYLFQQKQTIKKIEIMAISIENNVSTVIDFKLNGILVAVIGLNGGLTFLKSAKNLSYSEIDSIENACIEYHRQNCKLELA